MLGTFVTIRAESMPDCGDGRTQAAVECAFRTILRVERLMSFYRRNSDIGRLNRGRKGTRFRVHKWTYDVLQLAQQLHVSSRGLFNCDIGAFLMRDGLLPKSCATGGRRRKSSPGGAFRLSPDRIVRLNGAITLDLGGIAKGFAVDQAVKVLRAHGVAAGVVNAGGDLRVFGNACEPVWVRDPEHPGHAHLLGSLANGAIATSASYFIGTPTRSQTKAGAIVDAVRGRRVRTTQSISVIAKTCVQADAMTKIAVLNKGRLPLHLARLAQARVFKI